MAPQTIRVRTENRTAWITLDRPPLNVMDVGMMREISTALSELLPASDFLVFEGAGPKGFSAGAEVGDHVPERVAAMLDSFHGIFRELWRGHCLTIAAVHGHCLGGGCELATACDFVLATESARFGQPEIKLGCFPPVAMVTFPHLVGPRAALDLILGGNAISAKEAVELGLVTRLVPDGGLSAAVESLLAELRSLSPTALRVTRCAFRRVCGFRPEERLREAEKIYLEELMKTEDAREGISAFLEKRPPVWKGR